MDELMEAIMRAGKGVRRNEQARKAALPAEPEQPTIIATWPKKRLSKQGRRMIGSATTQNATLTRVE